MGVGSTVRTASQTGIMTTAASARGVIRVPLMRRAGSRAVVLRRSVKKTILHQEPERGGVRLGRNAGVLGVGGQEFEGCWVPGVAELGGQGSARRRGGGVVVRSTTTHCFLGEGHPSPRGNRRQVPALTALVILAAASAVSSNACACEDTPELGWRWWAYRPRASFAARHLQDQPLLASYSLQPKPGLFLAPRM